jgi:hypothetical protein
MGTNQCVFYFISLFLENESVNLAQNLEITEHTIVRQHYEIIRDFQLSSPKLASLCTHISGYWAATKRVVSSSTIITDQNWSGCSSHHSEALP